MTTKTRVVTLFLGLCALKVAKEGQIIVIQGFIKSYMQNILLIALAKDQCKNTPQFRNCQFKKFCSSG